MVGRSRSVKGDDGQDAQSAHDQRPQRGIREGAPGDVERAGGEHTQRSLQAQRKDQRAQAGQVQHKDERTLAVGADGAGEDHVANENGRGQGQPPAECDHDIAPDADVRRRAHFRLSDASCHGTTRWSVEGLH